MDFQDCVKFAREHRICFFATVQGDQPRVRIIQLWFADNTGFYFQCGTYKPFYAQLKAHKKVELCFFNTAAIQNKAKDEKGEPLTMMRVAGEVEFLDDDMELRARCIKEVVPTHKGDKGIMKITGVKRPEDRTFAVFRVYTGEAYFWTRDDIHKEYELEKIKF